MDRMRVNRPNMVEQALLVSQELIRVSILWHEMWHEGLEEASRLYFGDHNVDGMFSVLAPLHTMMERASIPAGWRLLGAQITPTNHLPLGTGNLA